MLNVFFSTYYHRRLNQQPVLQKLSEVLEDAVTNMLESSLGKLESPLGSREALDGTMAAVRALRDPLPPQKARRPVDLMRTASSAYLECEM